jgi:hypothetical protein
MNRESNSETEASRTELEAQVTFELEMFRNPRLLELLNKSNPDALRGFPDPIGALEPTVTPEQAVARAVKLTCTKNSTNGFWCKGISGLTNGVGCCIIYKSPR